MTLDAGPKEDNYRAECDKCGEDDQRSYLNVTHGLRAGAQADASRHDDRAHGGEATAYAVEVGRDE